MEHPSLWATFPSLWPTFGAFLLLFFSGISGSAWREVSFLNVQIDGRNIYFGVFGYTGISQPALGYDISQAVGPINYDVDKFLGTLSLRMELMGLIVHLVACILTFIAWAIMFWRRDVGEKAGLLRTVKRTSFQLAAVGTFFVWLGDLWIFVQVRDQLRAGKISADLGNAIWITLGAVLGLLIEPLWSLLEPSLPEAWQRRGLQPSVTNAGSNALGAAPADLENALDNLGTASGVSENAATALPPRVPVTRDEAHIPPQKNTQKHPSTVS